MAKARKPAHVKRKKVVKDHSVTPEQKALRSLSTTMTEAKWKKFIAATASGATRPEAANAAGITVETVNAYLVTNVAAFGQIKDARRTWLRREWTQERIDDIFFLLGNGYTLTKAFRQLGLDPNARARFYDLMLHDKQLRKEYDEIRELGAEAMADDIIDMADDTSNDVVEDGKGGFRGNTAAVNRARVMIDTRKWIMGKHVARRYGDTKHHIHEGDVTVNHAAVLAGGRKRLEELNQDRKPVRQEDVQVIEGEVVINND